MVNEQINSWMFRVKREYVALIFSLFLIILAAILLSTFNVYLFVGLAVLGLLIVRMQQARYMGNSVRVHSEQFPELFELFKNHTKKLGLKKASLFINQDPTLNAYTIGFATCSVVVTSALVEQLSLRELNFVLGHELGHFKAGHTRISTFVSPLGNDNWISSLLFGFWQRKAELTADRCGLIVTKDIDAGITSFIKMTIGAKLYKTLNISGYLQQVGNADKTSIKFGEILVDHPFTTNRIKNLLLFWRGCFYLR